MTTVSLEGERQPHPEGARRPFQRYMAEFIGTFALVFAGCGAAISDANTHGAVTHVGVALSFGFVLCVMIYALGPISAAHFNPSITIGLATAKRFPWSHVAPYIIAQCLGATFASLLHFFIFGQESCGTAHFGATIPSPGISTGQAFGLEVVMTFFLALVVTGMATDKRAPGAAAGLAIGLTVATDALFGGMFTGGSMNPARSLGPALFDGDALHSLPIYIFAPIVGAVLACLCFEFMRDGAANAQSAPSDL